MKKLLLLCALVALAGCSNITQKSQQNFKDIMSNISTPESTYQKLTRTPIELTPYTAKEILSELSTNLRNGETITYNDNTPIYEVYVGEYASVPANESDNFNIIKTPQNVSYDIKIENDRVLFRSLYQGDFSIDLTKDGLLVRHITFKNILKYDFSEKNSYDMINECYENGDLTNLYDNISLHRMAYPNDSRDKELSFLLIDLATQNKDLDKIKNEIQFLNKNIVLNDFDKKQLLPVLEIYKENNENVPLIFLDYNSERQELCDKIAQIILNEENLSMDEILFLENIYTNSSLKNKILEKLITMYTKQGNDEKVNEYKNMLDKKEMTNNNLEYKNYLSSAMNNKNSGNYMEAIMDYEKALELVQDRPQILENIYFDIGKIYEKLEKYDDGIEYLKKALLLQKNDSKKAEIYYNIATIYKNMGNNEQAKNYFTYIIQNYKGTPWFVKSKMDILND